MREIALPIGFKFRSLPHDPGGITCMHDKFPAKINKLTRDHFDLWTKMATVGSTCLQQDTINLSERNQIIFAHKGQLDIDEGK